MQPSFPTLPGMGGSGPAQAAPGSPAVATAPSQSTPEQRAKWREKSRLAYLRRQARAKGLPDPVPPLATPSAPSPGQTPDVPSVPWDPGLLKPFWASIVPEVEKLDVSSLTREAAPLGPSIVEKVAKDAPWNPVAKTTLIETGPAVTASILNSMGLSAEHAPTVAFIGALGAIVTSRSMLAAQLKKMVAEERAAKTAQGSDPLRKGDYHD